MRKFDFTSSILRFVNGRNNTSSFLRDQVEYITDQVKTDGGTLVTTQGCSKKDTLADMLTNKMLHQKTHGSQGVHFVLSCPTNGDAKSPADLLKVTQEIVRTVYPDYLAVIAVHTDSKVIHSHVVLDAVNAATGKKFSQGPADLNRVKQKANNILKAHGFEIIRMSTNDFVDHTDHSSEEGFDFLELDESAFITEQDMKSIDLDDEIINDRYYDNIWDGSMWPASNHSYSEGGYNMSTTMQESFSEPTPQQVEEIGLTLTEPTVPTVTSSPCYPNTSLVTGPTFRIKGNAHSDFTGLSELVAQTTAFAQEHQLKAANLALAMQTKAQESGHPTNVAVIAGPIFDIDLCGGDNSPQLYYGDYE